MSTEATEAARIVASILDNKDARITALEAENAKLRALVRGLVDRSEDVIARWDSPKWKWDQHTGEFITALRKQVAAAKEQGFTPTNTEDE